MWNIVKTEYRYNIIIYCLIAIVFAGYSIYALSNTQLLNSEYFGIDYWGGIIAGFLYLLYFILWPLRIREQRDRINALLPVSIKSIASANLIYASAPIVIIAAYLVVVHLILFQGWADTTASVIAQVGVFYAVFTTYIFIRELRLVIIFRKPGFQFFVVTAAVLFIALFIVAIFLFIRIWSYELIGWHIGHLIFFLPAVINLFLFYKMLFNRKTFL
jgi:hypothetical protein